MKNWLLKKFRQWVSKTIGYDAILVGSEIRMLKADVSCLNNRHDWQDWSATLCGNISQMEEIKPNHYSYRACRHCKIEMPESRIYHGTGIKQINAKDYEEVNYGLGSPD